MATIHRRNPLATVEVEIPEGTRPCDTCHGRGVASKYDMGWRSLCHDPELAAERTCPPCGGLGFVNDDGSLAEGADPYAGLGMF